METLFLAKLKYEIESDKHNEDYLISAICFTDAEAKLNVIIEDMGLPNHENPKITKVKGEVVNGEEDIFFKATYKQEDEKGKKSTHYIYVGSDSIFDAMREVDNYLTEFVSDTEFTAITKTNIVQFVK